jgi:hypothetical protein
MQFISKKYRKEILVGRLYAQIRTLEDIVRQRDQMIKDLTKVIREFKAAFEPEKNRRPLRDFIRRLRIRWQGK